MGLRDQGSGNSPGAQTESRSDAGPVRIRVAADTLEPLVF
jgi:hypothetical protein